jgi:hypothetical protein
MAQQHGVEERDRLWNHPDLLPTSDDLDEPLDFVARQGASEDLDALLRDAAGDTGDDAPGRPGTGQSDTGQSDTGQSDTGQSDTGQSDTGRPGGGDDAPGEQPPAG